MKNLWSKIAALIIPLALSQNIKAQELDSLDKKYFLKIEIGQYIFYENWLGKIMQFGLENETSLTKNTGLNFGIEYGSQKSETNRKEKAGFLILAEKSMKKIWDNKKDDEVWSKYL